MVVVIVCGGGCMLWYIYIYIYGKLQLALYINMYIRLKPPHTRFTHPHTSVGFRILVLPNLLQVTQWPIGGNAGDSNSVRG